MSASAPSYEQRIRTNELRTKDQESSLTERAQRICRAAADVRLRCGIVRDRVVAPTPQEAVGNPPPAEPDHLVFMLEQVERDLGTAIAALSDVQAAL